MDVQKTILVVDDEPKILKVVEQTMRKSGYKVVTCLNGEEALKKMASEKPSLLILDLMLPKMDGYEVCRQVRGQSRIPIIMLTAKADLIDKTIGFNLGVDDYVTKPFSPSELVLRVKAILRRTAEAQLFPKEEQGTVQIGDIFMDFSARQVTIRGQEIKLTAKEFELLGLFMGNKNQVFTREQLLYTIWDTQYVGDVNTVTVLIRRIREKIEADPAKPAHLLTVWGVGYKFVD